MKTSILAIALALTALFRATTAVAQEPPTVETLGAALSPQAVPQSLLDWAAANSKPAPQGITTRVTMADGTVRITETFAFADKAHRWATMPGGLALAAVMDGPVKVQEGAKIEGHSPFGPRMYVEGTNSITYTISIPQLDDYLFNQPAWTNAPKDNAAYNILRRTLQEEIAKILAAGDMMATFEHRGTGSGPTDQWDSPAETIVTLCWALPFLEQSQAAALKEYINDYYQTYDPLTFTSIGRGEGARREYYDVSERKTQPTRGRNMHGLYALWQYVHSVASDEKAAEVMPAVKAFLAAEMDSNWDAGESTATFNSRGLAWSCLNNRINGYIGAARLARLARDAPLEQLAKVLLARALAVRAGQAHYHQWLINIEHPEGQLNPNAEHSTRGLVHFPVDFFGQPEGWKANMLPHVDSSGMRFNVGLYRADWPYPFLNELTPELGQFFHDYARTPINVAVKWTMWKAPGVWLSRGPKVFAASLGEDWVPQPYVGWITFMTLATVTQEPPDELAWYVGDSVARFGDMYYLQRLAIALRAYSVADRD